MNLRTTHTFAVLELSPAAWEEIATKLRAAGYDHAFVDDGCIDMHGIGVKAEQVSYAEAHERAAQEGRIKCPECGKMVLPGEVHSGLPDLPGFSKCTMPGVITIDDVRFARSVPFCHGASADGRSVYVAKEMRPLTKREQDLIDAHEQMDEDCLNGLSPGMPPRVRRGLR